MKSIIRFLALALIMVSAVAGEPVKMSKSSICHAPGTTYYKQTKSYIPYPTLRDCLSAGGRMPKK